MVNNQRGVGLIEVLVSLLLLAVATLGFVAMQGGALKLTSESEERTRSLALMRDISEKVRVNPTAIDTYIEKINKPDTSAPTKDCGLYSDSAPPTAPGQKDGEVCNAKDLATVHSYYLTQKIKEHDFDIKIRPCPSTKANGTNSVMYSNCIISAWNDTTATVGDDADDSDGTMDCLSNTGKYHPRATCMQIGLD